MTRSESFGQAAAPPAREIWSLAMSMLLVALGFALGLDYLHCIGAIGDGVLYVALFLAIAVPSCVLMAVFQERRTNLAYLSATAADRAKNEIDPN